MKILLINKFLFAKGGDAASTLSAGQILSKHGYDIIFWGMAHPDNPPYSFNEYFASYVDYDGGNGMTVRFRAAFNILYSFEARKKMDALLERTKPDIVHLNNIAHQISPSILDIIKKYRIPTIMTMHDYKLVCPVYTLFRNGKVCEKCKGGRFYHCAINRCTKGNFFKSVVNVAEMYLHHRLLHIYDKIDLYIAPSRFMKDKMEQMGLKGKIVYLPNCVDVACFNPAYEWQEQSIVYAGRLSHEKGVGTLINAVKNIASVRLKIIGDGPMKKDLAKKVRNQNIANTIFLGYRNGPELYDEIRKSMFLVIPSEWYENNPYAVIEAFALGKPVIGARIGGIPELIRDWETGLTYTSGDINDLRDKICLMIKYRNKIPDMGKNARRYVEKELNTYSYLKNLLKFYDMAGHLSGSPIRPDPI